MRLNFGRDNVPNVARAIFSSIGCGLLFVSGMALYANLLGEAFISGFIGFLFTNVCIWVR
jgi:hypothetical protein